METDWTVLLGLVGLCLSSTLIFVGVWIYLEWPSPVKGATGKQCSNGCGSQGWKFLRKDFYTEHKICVRCGWVSHFDVDHKIGKDDNGS